MGRRKDMVMATSLQLIALKGIMEVRSISGC